MTNVIKLYSFLIGILIFLITLTVCDQYCLTSIQYTENDEGFTNTNCTKETLDERRNIILEKKSNTFGYQANNCDRTYVLDLGAEFTSQDDFDNLKVFIYQSLVECLDRSVGHSIFVSVFNNNATSKKCCGKAGCLHALNELTYEDAVPKYNDNTLIWNETKFATNYSKEFLNQLKKFEEQYCLMNSVVFITNRIVKLEPENLIFANIQQVLNYFCSSLTIMVIGREDSTNEVLKQYYGEISKDLYNIPIISCTDKIIDCMVPCQSMLYNDCISQNFTSCDNTNHLPSEPTLPTKIPDPDPNSAHIIYVYGVSRNMTADKYNMMQELIKKTIAECLMEDSVKLSIMFINYDVDVTTDWLDTFDNIENSLNLETFDDVSLKVSYPIDNTSVLTTRMMQYAVETINSNKITTHDKKIILLTDFISLNFTNSINGYSKNNLKDILFQVYCFSKPSYYYYKNETSFAKGDVFYFSLSDPYNSFHLCLPHHTTTEQPSDGGSNIGIILISTLGTCGILFLILCGGTVLYRKRIKKNIILDQVSEYVNSVNIGDGDIYEVQWNNLFYSTEKIGNGAYGQVYKGTFMGIPLAVTTIWKCQQVTVLYKNSMPIAIKILPKNADEKARENFLHEIEIMKRIGYHDNVVGMVGCITKIQPNALIMEYCENKDLYQFVKNMKAELVINNYSIDKRLSFQRCLLTFCMQITSGMKYLVSKGIIHRDLAARNIMIDNKNNIKIGDFGLCLEIGESDTSTWMENGSIQRKNAISNTQTYKCQKLPVKWLSPESLRYTIFTHSSDVWSFGMVMYEMYSFGGVPFHDVEPSDLLNHILKGCRPEQPEFASEEIYNIMERCWNENSEERPTFDELISEFMVLLEHTTDTDVYVDLLSGSIFYKNILPELVDDVIVDDEEMENENTSSYNRRPLKQSLSANVHATTNVTNDSISRSKTMLIPDFVKRLSRDFSPNHFKQLNVKRDSFFYHDHPRRKSESIVSGTPTSPTFMDNFNEFKKTLTNSTSKIFSKRD